MRVLRGSCQNRVKCPRKCKAVPFVYAKGDHDQQKWSVISFYLWYSTSCFLFQIMQSGGWTFSPVSSSSGTSMMTSHDS